MAGPLTGVKVIELGTMAAVPGGAAILAEWGADVRRTKAIRTLESHSHDDRGYGNRNRDHERNRAHRSNEPAAQGFELTTQFGQVRRRRVVL